MIGNRNAWRDGVISLSFGGEGCGKNGHYDVIEETAA